MTPEEIQKLIADGIKAALTPEALRPLVAAAAPAPAPNRAAATPALRVPAAVPAARASLEGKAAAALKALLSKHGFQSTEELDAAMEANAPAIDKWRNKLDGYTPAQRRELARTRELEAEVGRIKQEREQEKRTAAMARSDRDALEQFTKAGAINPRYAMACAYADGRLHYDQDLEKLVVVGPDGKPSGEPLDAFAKGFLEAVPILRAPPTNVGGPPLPRGSAAGALPAPPPPPDDTSTPDARYAMWRQFQAESPAFRQGVQNLLPSRLREPEPPPAPPRTAS